MNREILFRGKHVGNDEWICGSLLVYPDGVCFVCCPNKDDTDVLDKYIVSPETVGQYTGLTDKNGTKIFEGDILHFINTYRNMNNEWLCTVEFYEGSFVCRYVETAGVWNHFDGWNAPAVQWGVIGNVYDNPELLKGEENDSDSIGIEAS